MISVRLIRHNMNVKIEHCYGRPPYKKLGLYCLIYDNLLRGINDPPMLLSLKKTPAKARFYFISYPLTSFFFFLRLFRAARAWLTQLMKLLTSFQFQQKAVLSCTNWVRETAEPAVSTQSTLMIQVPLRARYYTILWSTNNSTRNLHAIISLMQTSILWWNGVAFFSATKKMASPKRSLLTQIRVYICHSLCPPYDNPWA